MKSQRDIRDVHTTARVQTWMEYLARIITIGTIVVSVIGIIGYSYDLYRHGQQKHYIGWFSSAGFVLLTVPISVRLIVQHLTHWNAPHIQKYVVRIIWMIPIYSVESWLALRFKSASIYIETIRECYEAYVIFCFFHFLIAVLGDEQPLILKLKQKPSDYGRHSWPISLFVSPWMVGNELLQKCKFGVFQYVLIKNLMAILVCILASRGQYEEGKFRFDGFYLYQCMISNASQLWALYCLVLFYFATKEELAPWRPVGKFLSVKTVVFFTWWQSIVINILASPLRDTADLGDSWTNNDVSKGLQDYLICIEMFFASIAFSYAFTHKDYQAAKTKSDEEEEVKPFLSAFLQSSVPDDILSDFKRYVRNNVVVRRVLGNPIGGDLNSDTGSDEESPLTPDSARGGGNLNTSVRDTSRDASRETNRDSGRDHGRDLNANTVAGQEIEMVLEHSAQSSHSSHSSHSALSRDNSPRSAVNKSPRTNSAEPAATTAEKLT